MRILHAIHDFLPRHQAGSEIYAFNLCRELSAKHLVHLLAAEYDPARPHGTLTWRVHEGLPVVELVNNWEARSFADTWRSPRIDGQLAQVLLATQPDVLHVHSLLNLSFNLPALARARGIPVVATLHDHTLACPAGGQRLHLVDETICETIDAARCASCFARSPFQAQLSVAAVGRLAGPAGGRLAMLARRAARLAPGLAASVARGTVARRVAPVSAPDVAERLAALRGVFDAIDLFVAPSAALAREHVRMGLPEGKIVVSDYGFPGVSTRAGPRPGPAGGHPLRLGFVGTLVRHKGVHVLLEAARSWPAGRFEIDIHGSLDTFPDYSSRLARLAEGLPVRFHGPFDPSRGHDVYGRFDLLVVPSTWPENSPLVIHEAFMAGVPVAASAIGGILGLVSHGVNGVLFEAGSAASLAAAVHPFLEAPERLEPLAARLPSVKTIVEDGREWEARYEAAIARRRG